MSFSCIFSFLCRSMLEATGLSSGTLTFGDPLIAISFLFSLPFSFHSKNNKVWFFTKSITSRDMFLSSLVSHLSSHHYVQLGATVGFGFSNRALDIHGDQLFELIRFLELSEAQVIQLLFIWLVLHRDDGLVPHRVESLRVVALSSRLKRSEMSRDIPSVSLTLKCS